MKVEIFSIVSLNLNRWNRSLISFGHCTSLYTVRFRSQFSICFKHVLYGYDIIMQFPYYHYFVALIYGHLCVLWQLVQGCTLGLANLFVRLVCTVFVPVVDCKKLWSSQMGHVTLASFHFAWGVAETKCILVADVCVSVCPLLHSHTTARIRM